jgi:hypothetical protein
MKAFFRIAAALTLFLGVAWLFFPREMLASWGAQGGDVTVYMARRYGGLFFGYATILWRSRNAATSTARTAILSGGAVVTTVLTVVSLLGAISGVVNPAIWSAVVVEAVLATAFGYFLLTSRKPHGEGDTTEVAQ